MTDGGTIVNSRTVHPRLLRLRALVPHGLAILALTCGIAVAETHPQVVTLPAAASIQGMAPFYSDVRVFNISYRDRLTITATYRCHIGNPCPDFPPQIAFALPPRGSRSFDDMVASTFIAPNTAGAVEFAFSKFGGDDDVASLDAKEEGGADSLLVTSRLYSTSPTPTVGMLIPGLPSSRARVNSVLTSLRNLGPGAGYRTNVGVFNPGETAVDVTFRILDGSSPVGVPVQRTVEAHSGVQLNGIFALCGVGELETLRGTGMVNATDRVFSYGVVIDNNTTDPYLVVGTEDLPQQGISPVPTATRTPTASGPTATRTPTPQAPTATATPAPPGPTATSTPTVPGPTTTPTPTVPGPTATRTPTLPGPTATRTPTLPAATSTPTRTPTPPPPTATPTRTPTPPPPTATPTPPGPEIRRVDVGGPGGSNIFVDTVEGGSDSHIKVGDTIHWVWVDTHHNTVSGTNCTPNGLWESPLQDSGTFDYTFSQAGTYPYYCDPHCDSGMTGTIFVTP